MAGNERIQKEEKNGKRGNAAMGQKNIVGKTSGGNCWNSSGPGEQRHNLSNVQRKERRGDHTQKWKLMTRKSYRTAKDLPKKVFNGP